MIDFERIRRSSNLFSIVGQHTKLKKSGSEQVGLCPFHKDNNPSFTVYTEEGVQRYKCFGCDVSGDVIDFVSAIENISKAQAVDKLMPSADVGKVVATYDYCDATGNLIFQVCRKEPKSFIQRRPDGHGGWIWNMTSVTRPLYNLAAVLAAETVWITEGEKDAESLRALGIVATTNAGGAKAKWEPQYTDALCGRHVWIVPDTDPPGQTRGSRIAALLVGYAASVRIVRLPAAVKDITDYLDAGQQIEHLTVEECRRPATVVPESPAGDWQSHLILTRYANPQPWLANVMLALREAPEWREVLWFNEFAQTTVARRPFPGADAIADDLIWTDRYDTLLTEWLNHHGISVGIDVVGRAVQAVAEERKYHPVREYLQKLRWDSTARLDTWLTEYLGVKPSNYTAAVGSRWIISAVARIYRPGAKADCCMVLEGPQGVKKSTALKVLAGDWFADEMPELGSKDAAIQTSGVWIIEFSELDTLKRSEWGRVKAFISRSTDRYRPPYAKRAIDLPRQCVFAGSVNHDTWNPDETGGRRFWPVVCGEIDIRGLEENRDQLWAEALLRYRDGAAWWLDSAALNSEAEGEQEARYESDPWEEQISDWLDTRSDVSVSQILIQCINKPTKDWTQMDKNRISRCLRSLRWQGFLARSDDGSRERRYRRGFFSRKQGEVF